MTDTALSTFQLGGDLPVARLGFGAMRLAQDGMNPRNEPRDPAVARDVLRRAVELGVNHIDTAEFYRSPDGSTGANDLIREALHPYPADLVIATKIGPVFCAGQFGQATAADMRELVEANLVALGVDRLDLVYLRIGMMAPPHGESLAERYEALAALQEEGLIRHLGLSNVDDAHLTEAQHIAPVAAIQNLFHPESADERALLRRTTDEGIAFVPFGPLGSGQAGRQDDAYAEIATRYDATVPQVALAHVLALAPNTLAIPGTGSIGHVEENVAAGSLTLAPADLSQLGV
ncbi:aldo/keto reductase [Promicromonospora alba]|uniref:Aldo/keto reductase n=1 Tax=Promicromonospora alba TaxID=1616110 RepID=A0ABV9HMG5_9MICO